MTHLKSHMAKRRLAQAEARAARQRKAPSAFAAGVTAPKPARSSADALEGERVRYERREQSVDRRQFHVSAMMSATGASIALGPLGTQAAVMRAIELSDAGYDRVVLKDAATSEELHFSAPIGPRD